MNPFQDAFISYGRADSKQFAKTLNDRLVAAGLEVWFDFEDIPLGVDYQKQIDDGIDKADNIIFIIAPHSINSPYCQLEIELAIQRHKRIIPILHVEEISYDTWQARYPQGTYADWDAYRAAGKHSSFQNMNPAISRINWVYAREGVDDFEQAVVAVLAIMARHQAYVHEHTLLLAQALTWERQQHQSQYLLIGEDRQRAHAWLMTRFQDSQPPCWPTDLHCEFITESLKNANNLMTQVYLAAAEADGATLHQLRRSLQREGITVWVPQHDVATGQDLPTAIAQGIEKADNLVYLLSPSAIQSQRCHDELAYAKSLQKRIIPIWVQPVPLDQMPPELADLHYIDLTDNQTAADYDLDESELLRILKQEATYHEDHKILLVKALKWERQHRNPSILLRGYNLRHIETWIKTAQQRSQQPPTPLQLEFVAESLRQPPAASLDVFVSYSRADSEIARQLNDALQLQGKTTWFDQESIAAGTDDFQQEIYRGIEVSDNILFILSPRSIQSPYCADEVRYAAQLHKRFVTVLYQPIDTADLPPELAKIQWIDFVPARVDFNTQFNQLVRTLDTDRDHVRSHTQWAQRALEWESKQQTPDLLLRGGECAIADAWLTQATQAQKQPAPTDLQIHFIHASQAALQAQARKDRRQVTALRILLGLVSFAFITATGGLFFALDQRQEAEHRLERQVDSLARFSLSLSDSDQTFEALFEALQAGRPLIDLAYVIDFKQPTQQLALSALQQAVYSVRERNRFTGHGDDVRSVTFSPDGQTLVSASNDGVIKRWALNGQEQQSLPVDETINMVAVSPDGQQLAVAYQSKTLQTLDWQGNKLQSFEGHQSPVLRVVFSPDGQTLASASQDGTLKLWDPQGKIRQTLSGHRQQVNSIAFSPDGQTLVSASQDGTLKLWTTQGQLLRTFRGHTDAVTSVAFSPDGQTLVSGSTDGSTRLWRITGEPIRTFTTEGTRVTSVAFSPDGTMIAASNALGWLAIWHLQPGRGLQRFRGHQQPINQIAFSPDSQTLISASDDTTIKVWDLGSDQKLQILSGHDDEIYALAFSPDGKTWASASNDGTIKLWNQFGEALYTLSDHQNWINTIAFSPNGQLLASGSADRTVKLWNSQGQLLHTLGEHGDWVNQVAFSPDGQSLISGSSDGTVKLWSIQGQEQVTWQAAEGEVWDVAFSPDGQVIASAGTEGTVKLWNLQGQRLHTLSGHQEAVEHVIFSPDGQMIASASRDGTVRLWNLAGEALQTLNTATAAISQLTFSPDGQTLAFGSKDGTVQLWHRDGLALTTSRTYSGLVTGLVFSPDNQTLIISRQQAPIELRHLATGSSALLSGSTNGILSIALSADGSRLAVGGFDGSLMLWALDPEVVGESRDTLLPTLVQQGCTWLQDYLTYSAEVAESDRTLCDRPRFRPR